MILPHRPGNERFFGSTGPHTVAAIAAAIGCEFAENRGGGDLLIAGLASIEDAGPDQISFVGDLRHAKSLDTTMAGAVVILPALKDRVPSVSTALIATNPFVAWSQVAALFHPPRPVCPGIHRFADVADDAVVDASAEVQAHAVIGSGAMVGAGCRIGPGATIGAGVILGPQCRIGANAIITHAILGARVYVYPGASIGQEGFGFNVSASGFVTVPQLGSVILEDDVEVGANSTIDRGALRDTVIGRGTRLDNLVQIAHNVRIGQYCAIAAQVGIAGSVEIGDFVVMGGQSGIAGHVKVGAKVTIGAQSGVMSDIEPGAIVVGSPARPRKEVFREIAMLRKLSKR